MPGSKGASEKAYTFVQRATSRPHHEATGGRMAADSRARHRDRVRIGFRPAPARLAVQRRAHRPANSPSRRIVSRHLRNGRRAKSAPVGDPCVDRCARNQ